MVVNDGCVSDRNRCFTQLESNIFLEAVTGPLEPTGLYSKCRMVGAIGIEPMTSAMSMCVSRALRSG